MRWRRRLNDAGHGEGYAGGGRISRCEENALPTATDQAYREGFFGTWLRRCGERPVKSFLLLWLILVAVWFVLGFVGFRYSRWPDLPVVPEAVPYADYSPGGRFSYNPTIDFDPAKLPIHNPALEDQNRHSYQVWTRESTGAKRFILGTGTMACSYGWPVRWFEWNNCAWWDVTDPTRPFQRFVVEWENRADDNGETIM